MNDSKKKTLGMFVFKRSKQKTVGFVGSNSQDRSREYEIINRIPVILVSISAFFGFKIKKMKIIFVQLFLLVS